MSMCTKIKDVIAREIIDSRGNPTVEVDIIAADCCGRKFFGRAAVPSGASTGKYEATELRDNDNRFLGKGVLRAVDNIQKKIKPEIIGIDPSKQVIIDELLCDLDGTANKSKLGANAILAVSLAVAKAAANASNLPLFNYLGGTNAETMPVPMMNVLNGGKHADNSIDIQEFMIVPFGLPNFSEALRASCEVYHTLQKVLKKKDLSTSIGDEGGFAPNLNNTEAAIEILLEAITMSGYEKDFAIALDVASSELYDTNTQKYFFSGESKANSKDIYRNCDDMIMFYENLVNKYPIISIEDPFAEEDWEGWKKITDCLGNKVQLVGDDLFVTNTKRLQQGIDLGVANSILIKVNQIGTLTETFDAIELAKRNNMTTIISHRSGETEDTTIADIAVAVNAGQIKTGAPSRSDRVAKYNQLLRIEEKLGGASCYCGAHSFKYLKKH